MRLSILSLALLLLGSLPRLGLAQQVPFFGGGVVAYDPEVSIAQSGAIMDAQATVSDDHKYVTIGMRATNSRLQSLQNYTVSTINQGFVGGANLSGASAAPATPSVTSAAGGTSAAASAARKNLVNPSPEQIQREARGWILARQGMYLVKPLP